MIHIRVPATSANMGPGFDSIGVALQLYNNIWVEEIPSGVQIEIKKEQPIPILPMRTISSTKPCSIFTHKKI